MLTALRIENFAIVKQLELDFANGMTAFTGETGAGKSIMIDALMLALGARADASVIRGGEEKCDIHAIFQIDEDSEPSTWLKAHDIDCEESEIILRRVLYLEGRSKSYINGQPFPSQKVRELSEMLVHIHGQHQHQTLMQHASHRQQLDNYAGHQPLQEAVLTAYKLCHKIKADLEALENQEKHQQRLELLQFQLEELNALDLEEGEMQILSEEHQRLHHAQDYQHYTAAISELLKREDDSPNVCQQINQILHWLSYLPEQQAPIKNTLELMNNALIDCEEAKHTIDKFSEQVLLDPERLAEVEERLSTLHGVARKYHIDLNQLFPHIKSLEKELETLKNIDLQIAHLQEQYQQEMKVYEQAAEQLSQSRKNYALKLGEEISHIIRQLGMPKGFVSLEITPLDKMQAHGLDKVEYKVCTNPGMPPDSLSKVVSGGELSRISLAIQMITAERGATPTLLFDEVDVGIGGATAALVGQLLRKLGERLQVFCVTHQPQVASQAHHHFVVEKYSDNEQTYSTIIPLKNTEKIDEIARMLGGLVITDQTRSHAKELLDLSAHYS